MKLTAELDNENHQIQVDDNNGGIVVHVDSRIYELSVREVESGTYVLINNGMVYECLVERDPGQPESFKVQVGNRSFPIVVSDPRQLRSIHGSKALASDGTARISSPMAGKVVRILVEQGAEVKTGDGIVVVEAMKMQNEMKSPVDGIVIELRASEGATVNAGEVLAIVGALTAS